MNSNTRFWFSATFAVVFAIIIYCITRFILPEDAISLSIVLGGLTFFLMLFALYIENKIISKKYSEFEKNYQVNSFFKTDACLVTGKENRYCRLFFCDEGIYIIALDKKPHFKLFIYNRNILKYETKLSYLYIVTKDNDVFCFTMTNINLIIEALKEQHWID